MDYQRIGIDQAKKFIDACETIGLRFESVFLFGSYATNKMSEHSDIDLILVSNQFSGNPFLDAKLFGRANLKFPKIEAHPYTTKKFLSSTSFLEEIKLSAIQIK